MSGTQTISLLVRNTGQMYERHYAIQQDVQDVGTATLSPRNDILALAFH